MQHLTVKELIETLEQTDPNTVVAIENINNEVVLLANEGYLSGEYYMHPMPRIQKDYYLSDELSKEQRNKMIKTIVINSK